MTRAEYFDQIVAVDLKNPRPTGDFELGCASSGAEVSGKVYVNGIGTHTAKSKRLTKFEQLFNF